MSTILSVFNSHCADLVIDEDFCKRIRNFDIRFINKNSDHVAFFSGPLLGVYPARWTDDEYHNWVDDIIEVDEVGLEQDIHALKTVNPAFRVVSNVVNLSFIYVLYRLYNSKLPTRTIENTAKSVIHIMHYKFITSIMAHYFRHPADKATAEATYNALTLKSDIRVTGSWGALVKLRGDNFTSRSSIHLKTFQSMSKDEKVLFAVSDIQTRIRKVIKTQTKLFYQIKENEGRVISVSSMMQTEQGQMVKDVARESSVYNRYITAVVPDKRDFVRVELFNVIMEANPSASPEVTLAGLGYMADVYLDRDKKYLQELVEETIVYSLNFLREKRIRTGDLANILMKVKSMLVGSRVNDDIVLKLRELGDRVINEASPRSKAIPTSPERTALLLYILLRALTKNYYSGSMVSGAIPTGKYKKAIGKEDFDIFSSAMEDFAEISDTWEYVPEPEDEDLAPEPVHTKDDEIFEIFAA